MVDSRAYRFAFLVRNYSEVPADFRPHIQIADGFEIGLFLPQDHSDRFAEPKYIPHLLLLHCDELRAEPHPAYKARGARVLLSDTSAVERAQFLLSAWIRISSAGGELKFPYPRREEVPVKTFLRLLAEKMLKYEFADLKQQTSWDLRIPPELGKALQEDLLPRENIQMQWCSPLRNYGTSDLLVLTTRRLIWISKTNDSADVEEFGYRLCYTPLQHWRGVRHRPRELKVLLSNAEWTIPIGASDMPAAEEFALAAKRSLSRSRLP